MDSVNLHFFYPQLFTGYDGNLVTAAGRTAVIVGSQVKFVRTIVALPLGGYLFDNQTRTLQKSSPGAGFETEFQRFRNNTAQLADLQDNRRNAPATGAALTDFNHTLGQG
jgi:mannitol-specific phosphotransferase system IIBC component